MGAEEYSTARRGELLDCTVELSSYEVGLLSQVDSPHNSLTRVHLFCAPYMNFRIFVESLTLSEMNELSIAIHETRERIASQFKEPLDAYEIHLIKNSSWIEAIKAYRTRNSCDLLTAKVKVDAYRNTMRKE
jgi:hypothetical protein